METAELQYQLGRPQRCLTTVHQMLDGFSPGDEPRRALWLEGLAYQAIDRPRDAVNSLAAAAQRGPADSELLFQLARAQSAAGQNREAADTARLALSTNGGHEGCRALLAQLQASGLDSGATIRR
jgi:predicted Zn-dependent protease